MDRTKQLIDEASRADPVALDELLVRYLPRLRAYIRLRMGPGLQAKESVSDLVQSACRDVLQRVDQFEYRGEASFRQWLFAAALHKVQKRAQHFSAARRDVNRELHGEQADQALADCYQALSTPSRELMRQEQIDLLESAINELTEEHREVILMTRIVGLTLEDAAEALGKSTEATRSLSRRALARLAAALERRG